MRIVGEDQLDASSKLSNILGRDRSSGESRASRLWFGGNSDLRGPLHLVDALESEGSGHKHGLDCAQARVVGRQSWGWGRVGRAHRPQECSGTGSTRPTPHHITIEAAIACTMVKEKNYNPVQEAKKADKQKQLRKQKAALQAQRNEKLARRNPNRIQRDIDSLKELDQSGALRPHERQRLADLEKDLAAVNKARAALGNKAPLFQPERRFDDTRDKGDRGVRAARGGRGGHVLGKRSRDGHRKEEASSDTDEHVQDIPMPRDTPPPSPQRVQPRASHTAQPEALAEPKKPTLVYEAAPQVRDFLKEATKFMPASVAHKIKLAKGEGRLLEPEEFDKLNDEGYMDGKVAGAKEKIEPAAVMESELEALLKSQTPSAEQDTEHIAAIACQETHYGRTAMEAKEVMHRIPSETAVAEQALRHVHMEEVEDETLQLCS